MAKRPPDEPESPRGTAGPDGHEVRRKRSRRRVPDKRRLIARDPRGFFSMEETCEITSLSRSQIKRMVERDTFPEYRLLTDDPNGRKGFRVFEVLKWLADRG
jgi:predicted DNA-binding transcriptional regulator AlpA